MNKFLNVFANFTYKIAMFLLLISAIGTAKATPTYNLVGTTATITINADADEIDDTYRDNPTIEKVIIINLGGYNYSIGYCAFQYCSGLTSITLPVGLTSIANSAFSFDTGLVSITLPVGLTSIGSGAFLRCSVLTSIILPASLTSIGNNAFQDCIGLTSITLPVGLTSIEEGAFQNCSSLALTSLPTRITNIGVHAFQNCSSLALTSLPSGLTDIGWGAFIDCSELALTSLPSVIKNIGGSAFQGCYNLKLTSIPSGLTSIPISAFAGCYGLINITLPSGLTSIGDYAFSNSHNLQEITILRSYPPTLVTSAFLDVPDTCKLYVPNLAALDNYKNDANWVAVFGDRIFVISGETTMPPTPPDVGNWEEDDIDDIDKNNPTLEDGYTLSFKNIFDRDKNTKFRVIYEIKNTKGRTIYKRETITSKSELEATTGEDYLEQEFHLRASGNGQGTIILTIKDMKGKILSTQSKTFEVKNIPPRIISVKKKK